MSKISRKGIVKSISLYQQQVDFLKFAVENKGAASEAEVIRWALDDYKKSHYPDYIWKLNPDQLTPGQLAKKRKLEDDTINLRRKDLSPEDFAKEVGVEIFSDKDGSKIAFMYEFINDSLRLVDPKDMKNKLASDPEWLEIHMAKCKKQSVMDKILENREMYEAKGIIIGVAPTKNERNQRDNTKDS